MSDPTYRIDVEHIPQEGYQPWIARVVRLTDERHLVSRVGKSSDEAIRKAQEWVAQETAKETGFAVYVDDDGRPVEGHATAAYCHNCHGYGVKDGEPCPVCSGVEGHSVKAS